MNGIVDELANDTDVVDRLILAPDPGLMRGLGTRHTLASAIADLVDNSIDAQASKVHVRFVVDGLRLRAVVVSDNGRGIDASSIDAAMTVGRRRNYEPQALGHFGVGLKAAGLGVARSVVVSSVSDGSRPVARRLESEAVARDFSCEILSEAAAGRFEAQRGRLVGGTSGVSVMLDDLRETYAGVSAAEAQAWLTSSMRDVANHLGLIFHRFIESAALAVEIEQTDLDSAARGLPRPVLATDPFAYHAPGRPGYPRQLVAQLDRSTVTLVCHVLPARRGGRGNSTLDAATSGQGFFVYRAGRLLQTGGWDAITNERPELQFGRVCVIADEIVDRGVMINPEKVGIKFSQAFREAVHSAVSEDGTTSWNDYLADLEETYHTSRRRSRSRKPTAEPAKGFAPRVRRVVSDELQFVHDRPMHVRWQPMAPGEFFDIDLESRTVWLNSHYRSALVPGHGGLNDAPLVKALVFLLMGKVMLGDYLGSREKDDIAVWQAVLGTAAEEERAARGLTT